METRHLPQTIQDDRGALARCDHQAPAPRTQLAHVESSQLKRLDKIEIQGLEVYANHGVYAEENKLGQKFVVSLVLYTDTASAGRNDDLSASIDYGQVAHEVDRFVREHTFRLIEAVAEGVADMLLNTHDLLMAVRVRIEKPWAPVGLPLKTVAVEIERTR